jgi:hypothetical protein
MVESESVSTMGLHIKNAEVEKLAAEVAAMTGETKTEADWNVLNDVLTWKTPPTLWSERQRWLRRQLS